MKIRYSEFSSHCKDHLIAILVVLVVTGCNMREINLKSRCPNPNTNLTNQTVGTAISIAPITAINLPAGTLVMSIQDIYIEGSGSLPGPYTNTVLLNSGPIITDITFTVNQASISFSTPAEGINPAAAGKVIQFTLRARVDTKEGTKECNKTYIFKIIEPAS